MEEAVSAYKRFCFEDLLSSSSSQAFSSSTATISDLPVDVVCIVFQHLPLTEVLRSQCRVSRIFYEAHLQHCRSSVKRLTLLGHYMVSEARWPKETVRPQSPAERKVELFKFARMRGSSSSDGSLPVINPSASHLKLVAGREEDAFRAIGAKFKSITHLELHHLALERHYDQIAAMITAWGEGNSSGGGGVSSNQLVDLKVFFTHEGYNVDGSPTNMRHDSACFAFLLSEALTPDQAPALRRLTFLLSNESERERYVGNIQHNYYHGERLKWVDLSQLQEIDAIGFKACRLPVSVITANDGQTLTNLRHLSVNMSDLFSWTSKPLGLAFLCQLTSLTFTNISTSFGKSVTLKRLFAALDEAEDGSTRRRTLPLQKLTLMEVKPTLSKLLRDLILPLTVATAAHHQHHQQLIENRQLEYLRVNFAYNSSNLFPKKIDSAGGRRAAAAAALVGRELGGRGLLQCRFYALSTLHLVRSSLLHRDGDLTTLATLFPNLVHLRLDGNYRQGRLTSRLIPFAEWAKRGLHSLPFDYWYYGARYNTSSDYRGRLPDCAYCTEHVWAASGLPPPLENREVFPKYDPAPAGWNFQHMASSTSDVCKEAFVRRAVAAWPTTLATITLQIEDFYETELKRGANLQYLYLSETLVLRDAATGEELPEEKQVWTVEKVPY